MPPAVFANYEEKIKGFQSGYGTVLFFEDSSAVEKLPPPLQGLLSKYPDCKSTSLSFPRLLTHVVSQGMSTPTA